jgi:hypothetical protein
VGIRRRVRRLGSASMGEEPVTGIYGGPVVAAARTSRILHFERSVSGFVMGARERVGGMPAAVGQAGKSLHCARRESEFLMEEQAAPGDDAAVDRVGRLHCGRLECGCVTAARKVAGGMPAAAAAVGGGSRLLCGPSSASALG